MTCKDCYGCEICAEFGSEHLPSDLDSRYFEYKDIDNVEQECPCFKDKSRFVELPCKVGDTVYLVDFEYGIYKCIVNDIQILSDNEPVYTLYFYSQNGYEPAELEWDIDIEIDCFGKTVFLTKEEAEQALKGREKNG